MAAAAAAETVRNKKKGKRHPQRKEEREKTGEQETNLDVRRWKEERKEGRKALALGDSQSVCFSCF